MDFWLELKSAQLTSPFLFVAVFCTLISVLIVANLWRKKYKNTVKLADTENIKKIFSTHFRFNHVINVMFLVIFSLLTSFLVAGPVSKKEKIVEQTSTDYLRIVVTLTDISASMRVASPTGDDPSGEKKTSFEIVQQAQINFLRNASDVIAGVVLFSSEPVAYIYPSADIDQVIKLFEEVKLLSIASLQPGKYPFSKLSSGTRVIPGLEQSVRIVEEVRRDIDSQEAVIVLFTDLQVTDSSEGGMRGVVDAMKNVIARNISLYIITNASEYTIVAYQRALGVFSSSVIFFRADSQQEVDDALGNLIELEKAPIVTQQTILSQESLANEISLVFVILMVLWVVIVELFTRQVRERR